MVRRLHIAVLLRAIPLVLVLAVGIVSFVYVSAPAFFLSFLYPFDYEEYVLESAARHDVDPLLVAAIIDTESNWDAESLSIHDARGLMQVKPSTAQDMIDLGYVDGEVYRSDDLNDPATNIEFGCAYLAYLLDYFSGSIDPAIAAYNAGPSPVDDWLDAGTVLHHAITYPETQAYLLRVRNAWNRYRDLYPGVHIAGGVSSSSKGAE